MAAVNILILWLKYDLSENNTTDISKYISDVIFKTMCWKNKKFNIDKECNVAITFICCIILCGKQFGDFITYTDTW